MRSQALSAAEAKKLERRLKKNTAKARSRNSLQALSKLTERVDGRYRIASVPPLIVPARELNATYGLDPEAQEKVVLDQFHQYPATLENDRRQLLERFEVVDWARKVVGVGSVGTRAFIVLLQGRDENDPLFLQVKEATRSVLEGPLRRSRYQQSGQRVVQGQRLMQATSDIFLGWTQGVEADRYFYWRQLRDMKGSAVVERMPAEAMTLLRGTVRVDPGPGPRPLRRPGRDRRLPRRRRLLRPVDHRLLRALRRPERARLRGVHRRHQVLADRGGHRAVTRVTFAAG